MKKYITGLSIACVIVLSGLIVQAQRPQEKKKVVFKGKSYLAGGQFGNGRIPKKIFDSLVGYPLVSKDSLGGEHPAVEFTFCYAERGAYEDSTGKLRIMTDYYSIESDKGMLPDSWIRNIRQRSKDGDTAIFMNIQSTYQDSQRTRYHSEPIKLIITE